MRSSAVIIAILFLVSTFSMTLVPVLAQGGSASGQDVHWIKDDDPANGGGIWKAIIFKTVSGMVFEWRYEWNGDPIDVRVIYIPLEKFTNEPKGKNWVRWEFDERYQDIPDGDEADLEDFLTRGEEYWVHSNHRLY